MAYDLPDFQQKLAELTTKLEIDKYALDGELIHQPQVHYEVSQWFYRAVAKRDLLKQELDLTKAQADRQLRERYVADGIKYTEALLANEVLMNVSFQNAQSQFSAWRHMADAWQALREATAQRSYVLKDLVALHIAGYYAESAIRDESRDATTRTSERVHDAVRKRLGT